MLLILAFGISSAQTRIPPPPCYANDNTGAGDVKVDGHFLYRFNQNTFEFR